MTRERASASLRIRISSMALIWSALDFRARERASASRSALFMFRSRRSSGVRMGREETRCSLRMVRAIFSSSEERSRFAASERPDEREPRSVRDLSPERLVRRSVLRSVRSLPRSEERSVRDVPRSCSVSVRPRSRLVRPVSREVRPVSRLVRPVSREVRPVPRLVSARSLDRVVVLLRLRGVAVRLVRVDVLALERSVRGVADRVLVRALLETPRPTAVRGVYVLRVVRSGAYPVLYDEP
jgi:hypothetical protein